MLPGAPPRFSLAIAFVAFTAAFFFLAWPWLSGSVTIPWDAKSQFFPQLAFLARSLAQGQSPFWTPNVYAGWPQIADPQSLIFSPLHVVAALLEPSPSFRSADAVVFVHLLLGGAGIILMFRDRGWHMAGALVAALCFAFGGSNASRLQHIGPVESLSYVPLALWLLARALDRTSWRWGLAAGVVGSLIAIGRDQVALLSLYILAGYVLWHWLDGPGKRHRLQASITPLAAGAAAGLLVLLVPVVLTALLAADSNRPEVGLDIAQRGSSHPAHLLTLLFADLFGAADPKIEHWGPPSFAWHTAFGSTDLFHAQNIGQLYSGALPAVALLGWGVLRGRLWDREVRFLTVAMLLSLLYALGRYTPAFQLFYELLPGIALYRRPADATFLFCALFAITGGYCIHAALSDTRRWTWRHSAAAAVAALAAVSVAAALAAQVGVLGAALGPLSVAAITFGVAAHLLQHGRTRAGRGSVVLAVVFALFTVADLHWNNAPHESNALPPSHYDALRPDTPNETVALLKTKLAEHAGERPRVELIGIGYHWPNIGLVHDFDHLFGQNPLRLRDFAQATNAADTVAVPEQRSFSRLLPSYKSSLESLFGVRFIATGVPVEQIDPQLAPGDLIPIARTPDAYVYENPRALPRVMLLHDWREADFTALLRDGSWPEVDPRLVVLLEKPPQGMAPGAAGGSARIVRYGNTEVVVETDAPAASILVLNDVWHPWWRACIGAQPTDILKANVLFRAVVVPAGRQTVRFAFHPVAGALDQLRPGLIAPRC